MRPIWYLQYGKAPSQICDARRRIVTPRSQGGRVVLLHAYALMAGVFGQRENDRGFICVEQNPKHIVGKRYQWLSPVDIV